MEDTRLLWALGNYSRFIRPGAVRVGVSAEGINVNNTNGLMVSSYIHEDSGKLVTVAINYGNTDASCKLEIPGYNIDTFKPYITSAKDGETLKPLSDVNSGDVMVFPKKSVITLVSDLNK